MFLLKIGTIRTEMVDRQEVEDIKKRWKEYTEELCILYRKLYQKVLSDLDNHDGVVTHPEPDILGIKSNGP